MRVRHFIYILFLAMLPFYSSCAGGPLPLIAVELNPLCVQDFQPGQQQQFSACIFIDNVKQPGFENSSVTWSVLGGDVNGTITQDGLYTAPNTNPPPAAQVTIIATSIEDNQKQGQATVIFVGEGTCDTTVTPECQ